MDVDPVRRDAHQDVGPGAGAQLAGPGDEVCGRLIGEVLGERGHDEAVVVLHRVRFGNDPAEPGLRRLVVRAVHEQHPAALEARVAQLELVAVGARDELLRVVRQVTSVGVRPVEVLGANTRAVRRLPPERGLRDGRGNAAPDDGVVQPGLAQQLRHLSDVTEHVG